MGSYNDGVIREFRENEGKVGGHWQGRDLLLLTTRGRKSGREHTTPMVFSRDGERLIVYASNGGAPADPQWYRNLLADPHVAVEVGRDRYDATAVPLQGAERDRLWAAHVSAWPHFGEYERRAGRAIPVVSLTRRRSR